MLWTWVGPTVSKQISLSWTCARFGPTPTAPRGDGHGLGSKFMFKTIEDTHLTKFMISCKFIILKYLFISLNII